MCFEESTRFQTFICTKLSDMYDLYNILICANLNIVYQLYMTIILFLYQVFHYILQYSSTMYSKLSLIWFYGRNKLCKNYMSLRKNVTTPNPCTLGWWKTFIRESFLPFSYRITIYFKPIENQTNLFEHHVGLAKLKSKQE